MPNAALLAPRRLRTAIARFTPRPLLTITRGRPSRVIDATAVGSMPLALTVTDPIIVASSVDATSARSPLHRVKASGAIAKDALLLSLEGLAQSADAFPPLKSAVGGLLFIVTQIELVSNNKGQIHDIYVQIDGFAESLVRAVPDITLLSPAAKEAIFALAKDLQAVRRDMEDIARQKRGVRFLRAKRHSMQLQDLVKRLDQADASFTRTMLASVDVTSTQILTCMQPLREEVHRLTRWARSFFLHRLVASPVERV